jgi:hypothetical protein
MSIMGPVKGIRLKPEKILARTITKRRNEPVVQILIKWMNTADKDATSEHYEEIAKNTHHSSLGIRML